MTIEYGMTSNGLNIKTYEVLLAELYDRWRESLGVIDTEADGVIATIATSLSLSHSEMWEIIQNVFNSVDLRNATGDNLRRLVALQGVSALSPTSATATLFVGGSIGTVIPQGSTVSKSTTSKSFTTDNDVTLSLNNSSAFNLVVTDVELSVGDTISLLMNDVTISVEKTQSNESNAYLTQRLADEILQNSVQVGVSSVTTDATDTTGLTLNVTTYNPYSGMSVGSLVNCDVPITYSTVTCTATLQEIEVVPANSIDTISTSISGWDFVTNPINGYAGSNAETDAELRKRLAYGYQYGSNGTENAIRTKIYENITDVVEVAVFSNRTDTVDLWGRDAHSVNVVVNGGSDEDVATQIYNTIPVGVTTHGAFSVGIASVNLNPQTISFDRIGVLFGWVKVEILKKNKEEKFPSNASELIRQSVFSAIVNTSELGADLVAQKLVGAVYTAVGGLEDINVTVSATGLPTTDPSIPIGQPWDYDVNTYSSGWLDKVVVAPKDKVEWRDSFSETRIQIIDRVG